VLRTVRETPWLDAVPPRWSHVTVADVAFTDDLEPNDVDEVLATVSSVLAGEGRLWLDLGPVQALRTAIMLPARPLQRLRDLRERVRRGTSAALGPRHVDFHRHLFHPHVSLGYVDRPVDARTASWLVDSLPSVDARVEVDALTLAAVTRRNHGYQWQVEAEIRPDGRR
jgi:2'-5' RNA ligase